MLKIAVVIVNYNSGPLLARCLQHLERQTRPADSVIVVDNASTDQSLTELPPVKNVRKIILPQNLGFAGANNVAIRQLENTDYVITLNPDAFPEDNFIETLEEVAGKHPEYASYACRMMLDPDTLDGAGDAYHVSGFVSRNLHKQPYCRLGKQSRDTFSACSGAAMYRADALEEVGGFDESFFCYMEDVDLGYRLQLIGQRCLYVPEASVLHLGSAITSKYPGFAVYHGHRNLVWTMIKNTPGPLLLLVLPAHLILSVIVLFVYLAKGEAGNYLRARIDAIRDLKRVLEQRRVIQLKRSESSWSILQTFDFKMAHDWKSRLSFF